MHTPEHRERSAMQEQPHATSYEEGISLSHVMRTFRRYAQVIAISLLSVIFAFVVVALVLYLSSPVQKITSLSFRLEFEGSNRGEYPNGTKFSTTEITSTPVLMKVYKDNEVSRFMTFERFTRAIFVLESNRAYERLALEYQGRLGDTTLNPVDRERIQKEYDLKRASLSQAEYSLNFLHSKDTGSIPASLINKVLMDSLQAWAYYAAIQKRALQYRVSVLSGNIMEKPRGAGAVDYIMAVRVLRARIDKILANIEKIKEIPGGELARTTKTQVSLDETKMRLEDILRFRLEPLVGTVRAAGLVRDPVGSVSFLEEQLNYDNRDLKEAEERTRILRDALTLYSQKPSNSFEQSSDGQIPEEDKRSTSTVMPQLGESFLDRLVTITGEGADREYRQRLVDQIRTSALDAVPIRGLVAYDQQLIDTVKNAAPRSAPDTAAEQRVQTLFNEIYADVSRAIADVNEIYQSLSRNLNPSTELFTLTTPPSRRTERALSASRLGLYGILTFLISIPITLGACLLHNRMKEEDAEEGI